MQLSFISSQRIDELAVFLEKTNQHADSHIGFCGEKANEIQDTLKSEFSDLPLDESFVMVVKDDKIIGALGVDVDLDDGSAEVWGPFVDTNENFEVAADKMWEALTTKLGDKVHTYMFFLNKSNERAITFADKLQADFKGSHFVLKSYRDQFTFLEEGTVQKLTSDYVSSFKTLHDQLFPETYYSGQDIMEKLQEPDQYVYMIKKNDREIIGYVYFEANPVHGEGNIEYVAVAEEARNRGYATKLIQTALRVIYQYSEIDEITLCVNETNMKAVRLYVAAGFTKEHDLNYYMYTTKPLE